MKSNTVYLVAHVGPTDIYQSLRFLQSPQSKSMKKDLSKKKVLDTLDEWQFLKEVILQTLRVADCDYYEVT